MISLGVCVWCVCMCVCDCMFICLSVCENSRERLFVCGYFCVCGLVIFHAYVR